LRIAPFWESTDTTPVTATPPSRRPSPLRKFLPWLFGAVGLLVSIGGAAQLWQLEQRNRRLTAEDEVSARTASFERDVRDALSLAIAVKAVFDASDEVSRAEFATLAKVLVPRSAMPAALIWMPRVAHSEREQFEASVRASGPAGFVISERIESSGPPRPSLPRPEYFPILYFEPAGGVPLGYDPGASTNHRRALARAADNAAPTADRLSDRTLPGRVALDVIAPVFTTPAAPDTVVARRTALRGFVAVHLDLHSFVDTSMTRVPRRMLADTWILDEQGEPIISRIETSSSPASGPVTAASLRRGRYVERVVQVADRQWTLIFHPQAGRNGSIDASLMVLVLGLAVSGLLVLYTSRLLTSESRLERLVEARTADLRDTMDQLQQAQKMEAVGRLTGGIAHDFNNLLTIVIGNLSLAREATADSHVRSLLDPALSAAERGADLTQRLLAFSRRQALQPRLVVIADLLAGMRPLIERTLGGVIAFETDVPADIWPVLVDPSQLEASVLNLCINARDAMPRGGLIRLELQNAQLSADVTRASEHVVAGDYVMLRVSDTGFGMDEQTRARAFEPFFTTKGVGKGSGLGLSMVFGFVKQSRGHITLESQPGHGTTVTIYFPRARERD
jgi:signal transduction histidine kinase